MPIIAAGDFGQYLSDGIGATVSGAAQLIGHIIVALVILLIGYIVARFFRALLQRVLVAVGFDSIANRAGVGTALQRAKINLDAAGVLAALVFWFIFLFFIDLAVQALGIEAVTVLLGAVIAYLPNVFAAILILIVFALVANLVADLVRGAAGAAGLPSAGLLAGVARWGILLFAFSSALSQLKIAEYEVNTLFTALVATVAIAAGIAFGLGGVDSARNLLNQASGSSGSLPSLNDQQQLRGR
jgi:hypothetical protein